MKVGWMWFDNSKRSLEEKIATAVQRYQEKHGRYPNACYVNRRAVDGDGFNCGKVKVIAAHNILPNNFWLGIRKEPVDANPD